MLIACNSFFEVKKLKEFLSSEFDMKDLGEAKKILGMDILRDQSKGILYLSQRKYIEKVVQHSLWVMQKVCLLLILPLILNYPINEEEEMVRI